MPLWSVILYFHAFSSCFSPYFSRLANEAKKEGFIKPVMAANGPSWLVELRLLLFLLVTLTKMKGRPGQAQTGSDSGQLEVAPALHLSASHSLRPRLTSS